MKQSLVVLCVCIALLFIYMYSRCKMTCSYSEDYGYNSHYNNSAYNNGYYQMSHLPYESPPTGGYGSLGHKQKMQLRRKYPPMQFSIGDVPEFCPPCGISIYETGNAENPNIYSVYGNLGPEDI